MTYQDKIINSIINSFDFHKIQDAMFALKWTWEVDGKDIIPSINKLMEVAKELIIDALENEHPVSSGGFVAFYDIMDNTIDLSFVLEKSESIENES